MRLETSEIIDLRMDEETRERLFDYMKHDLFRKIADEIPSPSGRYELTLQAFEAPFDGFGRRITIFAEIKKDDTTREVVIRLPSLIVGREEDNG